MGEEGGRGPPSAPPGGITASISVSRGLAQKSADSLSQNPGQEIQRELHRRIVGASLRLDV